MLWKPTRDSGKCSGCSLSQDGDSTIPTGAVMCPKASCRVLLLWRGNCSARRMRWGKTVAAEPRTEARVVRGGKGCFCHREGCLRAGVAACIPADKLQDATSVWSYGGSRTCGAALARTSDDIPGHSAGNSQAGERLSMPDRPRHADGHHGTARRTSWRMSTMCGPTWGRM